MGKFLGILVALWIQPAGLEAEAKEYPIFDGRTYNGLFYPRVDIIEWTHKGQPPHLELHIYSKDEPIEIQAKPIQRGGNKVLLVNYYFTKRKETVCRSVIAPASFAENSKLYFYRDKSDAEYDNIYVSVSPKPTTKNMETYAAKEFTEQDCNEENSDDMKKVAAEKEKKATAASGSPNSSTSSNASGETGRDIASERPADGSTGGDGNYGKAAPRKKHELINYENNAMPFNF